MILTLSYFTNMLPNITNLRPPTKGKYMFYSIPPFSFFFCLNLQIAKPSLEMVWVIWIS